MEQKARVRGLAALGLVVAVIGSAAVAVPVEISGLSPNPDGGDPNDPIAVTACNGGPQTGVVYRNTEVEPYLAVNPTDGNNMIAGWHQDRWSNGAAQSLGVAFTRDGGLTWTQSSIPFTRCSGGGGTAAGDYERASDPWISFSPDGTAHYMALVANDLINANGMVVARSSDGGQTWSAPVVIKDSPAQDTVGVSLFHDKNSITADPFHPNILYATWTVFRRGSYSVLVSRSTDGGRTWGASRPVGGVRDAQPADLAYFRQGAQIVVLPDGTLRNFFYRILFNQRDVTVAYQQATFESTNQGRTWTKLDDVISAFAPRIAFDPELFIPVRDAGPIPDVAVNPQSGDLYSVWQDDSGAGLVGVMVARSTDGGLTWSDPVAANGAEPNLTGVQAFLPSVAVNDQGQVGVMFYDFRDDVLGDAPLSTSVRVSVFEPDLTFVGETTLTTAPMDLRQSAITGGRGYFPGDYVGFSSDGSDFVAAFTRNNDLGLAVDFPQPDTGLYVDSNNRTNIVFERVVP